MIDKQIDLIAREQIINYINKWRLDSYLELPSEWAERCRHLPQGTTARPGKIDHSIAPHMVEICNCAHPDSGVKQTSIMKSTQSLATTTVEHVIGWAIDHGLHNILYIISSLSMAKQRSSAAIDVLIDYSGLADKMKPISSRMKRKTGDNTFWKEFAGGYRLMMTSWNSIADAKSFSWDLIIMDELDEAPFELSNQGDPEVLFSVRGITAKNLKIFKLSTPTTTHGRIYKNFMDGDRRYYNCQCPHCGELQVLQMMLGGRDYGLFGLSEKKDNIVQIIPESVKYTCKYCKSIIFEYQKQDMLTGGKWIPTARPINNLYRSYHISNLMSPIFSFTWHQVMQQFCETDFGQKITAYKGFLINILGEPWESKASKKNWEELKEKAEDYQLGAVPTGGLIITAGCDVQKHWIEVIVTAWGRDMESWVIDHKKFHAEDTTRDKNDRCWNDLKNFIITKKYNLTKKPTIDLMISRAAIDSGYNPDDEKINNTDITAEHTVYEFVARCPKTIACRGNYKLKDCIIKEERIKKLSPLKIRYDHAVNELKDEIFVKVDFPIGTQGYMHFSKYLSDDFFKGFLSEVYCEISSGKWGYRKMFDRNEPLDCWILSRVAAEQLNIPTWDLKIWNDVEMRLLK